ncbi:hypothetical protein [Photobacterium nomapromontoriensis]|uniref:hypothetical protein n=1 Tax=Photobacterium nomapromontoriensis TaxID=2910237 RepID=UPI003D10D7B3
MSEAIVWAYQGKSKYVTRANCLALQDATLRRFNTEKMARDIWPMLSTDEYEALSKEIFIMTELIDKDNSELFSICE